MHVQLLVENKLRKIILHTLSNLRFIRVITVCGFNMRNLYHVIYGSMIFALVLSTYIMYVL